MSSFSTVKMGANRSWIIAIIFLLCINLSYAVIINEIMYNPEGSDSGREWIEIYNEKNFSVNISGWKFYESGTNHGLSLINGTWNLTPNSYAIIADNPEDFLSDYPGVNISLFDSSFSLNNEGEYIAIKNSSLAIIDYVNYSSDWGDDESGFSLEKIEPLAEGNNSLNWGQSITEGGTPGNLNSLHGKCDWEINVLIDDSIFVLEEDKIKINWKIEVSERTDKGNISFEYWIEDFYGNIVKSKIQKTASESETFGAYQKTFSYAGGYIIIANITNASCIDYNLDNNLDNKAVIVKGGGESSISDSSINVISIPETANFDDSVDVNFNVYRGDTARYAVYLWVEDFSGKKISDKLTFHFKTKFTNYTLKVPVQLYDNCDSKYDAGEYFVVIEGLNITTKESFYVADNEDCPVISDTSDDDDEKEEEEKTKLSYELVYLPAKIKVREPFKARLKIINDDTKDREFKVWSYVYRGSKSYSGDREENAQYLSLSKGSSAIAELENIVLDAEPGDYKYKVRIRKDNQKTLQEITRDVAIEETEETIQNQTLALLTETESEETEETSAKKGKVTQTNIVPFKIYESSTVKARNLVVYFLLILFALVAVVTVWKKQS